MLFKFCCLETKFGILEPTIACLWLLNSILVFLVPLGSNLVFFELKLWLAFSGVLGNQILAFLSLWETNFDFLEANFGSANKFCFCACFLEPLEQNFSCSVVLKAKF